MRPNLRSLVKECVIEVLAERLLEGALDYFPVGAKVRDIYGNTGTVEKSYVDKQHLTVKWDDGTTSEVHYTWIRPAQTDEGFDPLSQGPNIPEENPYPQWNNHMRTLEEDDVAKEHPHGRYAQQAGATPFETPLTFQEIRNREDPDGTHHDLALHCIKCGTKETCRCSKPKRRFEGICDECATC
jgi:hypothetical protein